MSRNKELPKKAFSVALIAMLLVLNISIIVGDAGKNVGNLSQEKADKELHTSMQVQNSPSMERNDKADISKERDTPIPHNPRPFDPIFGMHPHDFDPELHEWDMFSDPAFSPRLHDRFLHKHNNHEKFGYMKDIYSRELPLHHRVGAFDDVRDMPYMDGLHSFMPLYSPALENSEPSRQNPRATPSSTNGQEINSKPSPSLKGLQSHAPIRIDNDTDFANQAANEGWKGSGTEDDPYIIENYEIDAHGGGNAIYVGNSTAYFEIRNCTLYNASYQSSPYHEGAGVTLYNVQHGTISNNSASNNSFGIYLDSSSNNSISNNTAKSNNWDGISLDYSNNNVVLNNSASNNLFAIFIIFSSNITLCGNTMKKNSIFIFDDPGSLENWNTHTIDTTNTVNGKPVYYWKNRDGGKIPNGAGEVILANCTNITVENQNLSYGSVGIEIAFSNNTIMSNNTLSNNSFFAGLIWAFSSRTTISNNTVSSDRRYGIVIGGSNNTTISNNTLSDNFAGIYLLSSDNSTILNNTLIDDGIFVYGYLREHWNTHTIDTTNTVNGKPVYYWKNRDGGKIPNGAGEVILANCTAVTVEGQNISGGIVGVEIGFSSGNNIINNHWLGIFLQYSSNNTVNNNTIYNSSDGIQLYHSSNNTISNNTASNNYDGIYLYSSSNNTISNNNASNNHRGLVLYSSSNNRIYHNNFINNTEQAYDYDGNNYWNASYPTGGNYWSDYNGTDEYSGPNQDIYGSDGIGDTPYTNIGGGTGANDSYPLMHPVSLNILTSHTPIRIDSNADFDAEHGVTGGNGTEDDPYIIENYDIDGSGYGYCIYVGNTTDYFVIRNCSLHDASYQSWPYYVGSGVMLYTVQYGTISNNTASDNDYGIYLESSSNNSISNNTAKSNNWDGIYLQYSNNNGISNNTASNNWIGIVLRYSGNSIISNNHASLNDWMGIGLDSSSNGSISNNTASNNLEGIYFQYSNNNSISNNTASNNWIGIDLDYSDNNTLSNNTMVGDGIVILGDNLNHWNTQTIDTSNTVNGKPVYYWKNRTGGTVPSGAGEVILANCTNVIVESQNLSDGSVGVELGFSNNTTISNNNASHNGLAGVFLEHSSNNIISNNTASNNWIGIVLDYSSNNKLSNNTMVKDGIVIYGDALKHWNTHTIDTSNTVNGKPVYYWKNRTDGTVLLGAGEVILANCTGVTVERQNVSGGSVGVLLGFSSENTIINNSASNNWDGIYLYSSDSNTISNNTASNNYWYGIRLESSSNNSIHTNTAFNNIHGITLSSSSNGNTISTNTVSNNYYGISLWYLSNNRIYHNNFINNTYQAYDSTGNNYWNASYPTGGNYWSDYNGTDEYSGPWQNETGRDGFGDTPYTNILGGSGVQDNYPLMSPVQAIELDLNEGWNLISIPWQKEPKDIESVLSGIWWDRAMVYLNGTWHTYNKNRDAKYNLGFPKVDNTMGIWVHVISSGKITGYAYAMTSTEIHLYKGWNLVSYPSNHDKKVSDALTGIPWEHVQTTDADGNMYSLSKDNYMLAGGRAYWIYVSEDCVWTVDW